ncbi:MAG: MFS transporter [Proteobacteria bacterium]|nr:MFS transporter [Pseudomonadota bacterium]
MSDARLVAWLCLAHALSLLSMASYPALLPTFVSAWDLTNTEAGWIAGIYYAGYMLAVPILSSATDHTDARRVYLAASALTCVSTLGFALLADGFWSALAFRFFAGIGLAGTYMPGLKALTDRLSGKNESRYLAFYTAIFGLGVSLSFLMSGEVAAWLGWRAVFITGATGSAAAFAIFALVVEPREQSGDRPETLILDFRPVLRTREAMGYVLAYATHAWELFAMREWMVAFLTFAIAYQALSDVPVRPTVIVAIVNLMGLFSSIIGNECSVRYGRRRVITIAMWTSAALVGVLGFTAGLPYLLIAGLCVLHGITVSTDSASITAGAVQAAPRGYRGTTLAVHSAFGFCGGFLGPLAVGVVLDVTGGDSVVSWGLALLSMGAVAALGPVALALVRDRAKSS